MVTLIGREPIGYLKILEFNTVHPFSLLSQHFLDGQLDRSFPHRSLLRTIEEFVRKLRQKATHISY